MHSEAVRRKMFPTTRNLGTLVLAHRALACAGVNLSVQEAGACALESRAQNMF